MIDTPKKENSVRITDIPNFLKEEIQEYMKKRYGFIYVDMDDKGNGTLKRTKKKSYDWMKHIIETNGKALDEKL